ncbi:MAG TPA: hypothetical protein VFU21_23680 [Kofleriaceae bacterium]|nr:hypothetical protein [Kofleriaceae bacterium]
MRRAGIAVAVLVAGACARHVPPTRPAASLYRDLERIVTVAEAAGWHIDRLEIDAVLSDALESTCRATPGERQALAGWLDGVIAEAGGPVERAFQARGRDLDEVSDLLTLTRIRLLLARAAAAAATDCPFWMEPDGAFRGRQISDRRWQLSGGGGGKGIYARKGGSGDLRFGGAGRVLIGRGLGERGALYTGLELGGSGAFPRNEDGERGTLVIGYDAVVPVVYRHTLVNSYLELEGGWLGTGTEEDVELEHGIHLGAAFGARALRTRFFFPGAAIGLSWERTFPASGAPQYTVKLGLRAAFDIDL